MSNQDSTLKPYPSGFLGSSTVAQTATDNLQGITAAVNQMFNRANTSKINEHNSNLEVNSIWSTVLSGGNEHNSFEFKQRILKAALNAFGTDYFIQWLSVQAQHPEYTKSHHDFIDETISFIYYGKKRQLAFSNWALILTANKVENNTIKYSELQTAWMQEASNKHGFKNSSKTINDLVYDWVRCPKGIEDLTSSLFVLFGIR